VLLPYNLSAALRAFSVYLALVKNPVKTTPLTLWLSPLYKMQFIAKKKLSLEGSAVKIEAAFI
jgi:hypothetical protein